MKKVLLFSVLAVLLSSCSSVLITGRKQLLLVSGAEMLSMSTQSYKQLIDSVPASKDVTNTKFIKKVGGKIATAVESYFIKQRFRVGDCQFSLGIQSDKGFKSQCILHARW